VGDLYSVLGVARTAEAGTIHASYRSLARQLHPDVGGDEHAMATVNAAYYVLGEATRRAVYDSELRALAAAVASVTPTPRQTREGHTIIDFGRYAGWTLANVAAVDDDYLVWLSRTPTGRGLRREIAEVLDQRARGVELLRPVATMPRPRHRLGFRR
jgi:curved DNA-binding protein CbpA